MNSFYRSFIQPLYLKAIVEPFWKLEERTRPQSTRCPPRPRWWPPYAWQIVINMSQRVVVERPWYAFQLLAWKCL